MRLLEWPKQKKKVTVLNAGEDGGKSMLLIYCWWQYMSERHILREGEREYAN